MKWRNIFSILLLVSKVYLHVTAVDVNNNGKRSLNIAIVGAGAAGLVTAKHCIHDGHNVTIFEQNDELGGVWIYTDQVGKNKYGLNIHSAMYKDLRTNAPLPIMEFPGHRYPNGTLSFPSYSVILKYLQSFADRFKLKKLIKFEHFVAHINPIENEKWEIIVKDLMNNKFITQVYDAVFVCNGHFSVPFIPKIRGFNEYKGKVIHSHDYRTAEAFHGDDVLIIGDSSSGQDLMIRLTKVAKSVTLSRKNWLNSTNEIREEYQKKLPAQISVKDIVRQFTVDGAYFVDGTKNTFSAVILATGYKFSFPFLSVETGIHVDDNFVQPLYKQLININHPTLALIGLPRSALNFAMFDLQARFALKFLSNEKKLPSSQDMLEEQQREAEKLWSMGIPKRKTNTVVPIQKEYFDQMSNLADIERVPSILITLALEGAKKRDKNPTGFRDYKFTVIDDKTYTREKIVN